MTSVDWAPVIYVNGTPGAPEDVLSLRIERGVRLIGRITLRLGDHGYRNSGSGKFDLGTEIKVTTFGGDLLMVGKVTSTQMTQLETRSPELVVTADDAALRLTRGSKVTTYAGMTYSQVVSQIAQRLGLSAKVVATDEQFPYMIQSGSDLQFLEDISDRIGYDWWIGGTSGAELVFGPPVASDPVSTFTGGDNLIEFGVRASGLHPTGVTVTGWSPATQATVSSAEKAVRTGPGTSNLTKPVLTGHITSGSKLATARATTIRPGVTTAAEANALAASLSDHAAAGAISARGKVEGTALIQPGVVVEVKDVGNGSGRYRITQVEHHYSPSGFFTRFTAGDRRPTGLLDLLGARPANAFSHQGLVTGTVTNNNDSDGLGRIQVLINGLTTSDTSAWARIATHGAGKERGFVVMPEVGDEVLVGFEDGDTRRPVILGGLFGGKGKMDAADDYGVQNNKTIDRSLISRLGYRMEISDGDQPSLQHVRLSLEKGDAHMLRLGKDKVQLTVPDGVPVEIKAGAKASFIIDDQGNVTIKGQKVTIEAQTELAIKSVAGAVGVSAPSGELKMDGMQFSLKGSAKGEVNGGGMLAVKGGMVQIN
jgi:phage protein D